MDTAVGSGAEAEHGSRWPLVTAAGAAALYAGAGLTFVGRDLAGTALPALLVGTGLVATVAGLAGWTREAFLGGRPAGRGREGVYTGGMVLFLVSDVATFLAGFVFYGFVRAGAWPPAELPPLLSSLVLANTLVLVASSLTLHRGHRALEAGDDAGFRRWLAVTVLLGAVFVGGQALEYAEFLAEGFGFAGAFGTAFYGLTGLHGLHVALGVVLLALTLWRAVGGAFGPERDTGVRTVSLYWHFVDGVWLVLVATLYVGAAL